MAKILKVYKGHDPILRTKCRKIERIESWVMDLANDMWMTMLMSKAVGLAANQVGFDYSMITVSGPEFQGVMINPIIISASKEIFHYEEGCLSLPGYGLDTGKRSENITVQYQDLAGVTNTAPFTKTTSVIIQHETDHLMGVLMVDHINSEMMAKK